jgi:hypothetical protein
MVKIRITAEDFVRIYETHDLKWYYYEDTDGKAWINANRMVWIIAALSKEGANVVETPDGYIIQCGEIDAQGIIEGVI